MPAVGIVLILIGLWIMIRTLRGGLASTLSRVSDASGAPATHQPAASAPSASASAHASEWLSPQGRAALQQRQRQNINPAFGPAPGIPDPLIQTGL